MFRRGCSECQRSGKNPTCPSTRSRFDANQITNIGQVCDPHLSIRRSSGYVPVKKNQYLQDMAAATARRPCLAFTDNPGYACGDEPGERQGLD